MSAATRIGKWARFRAKDGGVGCGVIDGDDLLEHEGSLFAAGPPTGRRLAAGTFKLLSPCEPAKVVALWNNFHALAAKLGKAPPTHPLFLIKPGTAVIGPEEAIRRPASYQGKIVFEGELGIVIGRTCKEVSVAAAPGYILGYTCVNDVTASELLTENPHFAQWCRSKSYDTFGCIGPVITTELDWAASSVVTRMDGVERQNYKLSDMVLSPAEVVSGLSHDMSLLAGDVIACGTSLGVGAIKDGATVEVTIEGIGTLANTLC